MLRETAMSFTTLTEDQVRELYRLYRFYWQEARRCEKSKAYLAGCLMLGSALETLLMLMINVYPDVVINTGKTPTKGGRPKPLFKWTLSELLDVAKTVGWLPSALDNEWSSKKAKIGDYAEESRQIRNLIHPARYAEDHFRKRITARYLAHQFKVVGLCQDWLAYHNAQQLLKHMENKEDND
ncbi:hypothetical protein NRY68_14935 [Acidithiobacillus ferrooxidans]|uniref:hypothetical protein n=1 Tax=Acidithiobacillus ferrooxidans TaxID=920 RepID=UPI00214777E0|nr:hypothetical protein [Acidithiobacillus ferrooxidans]MCR1347053.1 hypothetical protein [Acidithiobacillus ferrooxidans]MCR1355883.1 hypothetical protein [Acidithiobacillus ferrooxidans]